MSDSIADSPNIPYGYCQCGCGQRTRIAKATDNKRGYRKGEPKKFVFPHRANRGDMYVVDGETGCWNWDGYIDPDGYGHVGRLGFHGTAHRWMFLQVHGSIQDGYEVHHICSNRSCVNPDHLQAVTPAENKRLSSATKLSFDTAEEIRFLAKSLTNVEVAQRYGVSESLVSAIVLGLVWADRRNAEDRVELTEDRLKVR